MNVQKRHLLLLQPGECLLQPGLLFGSLGTAPTFALPVKIGGIWAAESLDIAEQEKQKGICVL